MNVVVLYGTESGNSELVAHDLAEDLAGDHEVRVQDLSKTDPAALESDVLHIVVCSTYGDGEAPRSARPFIRALTAAAPDLRSIRYAIFGLGDSDYVYSYSLGSEVVDRALTDHGAVRMGAYGRHDAADGEDPSPLAQSWAREVLAHLTEQP